MTIPAKIVAGAGHVTVGTGLNLLGTAVNTTEDLVGLVADTGKDLLDTLKNPLKKDVWKAIGNRHKSRIKNFTAHQKAKFVEYTEPLKIKGAKRNTINQLARGGGKLTHAVTGGAVLGIATVLDTAWRIPATPVNGFLNRFRKKDKKVKLWESFRKNQKKRKEKFDSGFSELKGEVREKIDEAVDKVNEEVKEILEEKEVLEDKEVTEKKEDFVKEEVKRNKKNNNQEKGKKENISTDSVGQKKSEQEQIAAEEQRVKAEIEEIKGREKVSQKFTSIKNINRDKILRKDLKENPEVGFIFGDNLERVGSGGQAGEMRGEKNALGIATLYEPGKPFKDEDFKTIQTKIDADFKKIHQRIDDGKPVIIPKNGVGTGIANLQENAPKIAKYINNELEKVASKVDSKFPDINLYGTAKKIIEMGTKKAVKETAKITA